MIDSKYTGLSHDADCAVVHRVRFIVSMFSSMRVRCHNMAMGPPNGGVLVMPLQAIMRNGGYCRPMSGCAESRCPAGRASPLDTCSGGGII